MYTENDVKITSLLFVLFYLCLGEIIALFRRVHLLFIYKIIFNLKLWLLSSAELSLVHKFAN